MVLLDEQLHLFNVNYDIMICLIILYLTLFYFIVLFAFNDILWYCVTYLMILPVVVDDNDDDSDDFHELNFKVFVSIIYNFCN